MPSITYRQILEVLETMDSNQLDQTATVFLTETAEFLPISVMKITSEADVLDENHLYFEIDM